MLTSEQIAESERFTEEYGTGRDEDDGYRRYKPGDAVFWNAQRKWGGKQVNSAIFVEYSGRQSARISMAGQNETITKIVRLRHLRRQEG